MEKYRIALHPILLLEKKEQTNKKLLLRSVVYKVYLMGYLCQ